MCSEISLPKSKQTSKNKKPNPKRMSKKAKTDYVAFLLDKGICQICDESYELDMPHHEPRGTHKDDRYQIAICIYCHRERHSGVKGELKKSIEEIEEIAKENWEEYNAAPINK